MNRVTHTIILSILAVMLFASPASAGVLPEVEGASHYITTLYGGTAGQQIWYTYHKNLTQGDEGELLGAIEDISQDLTPLAMYGWYRIIGNIAGSNPEESHDYLYGIQYNTDTTPGAFAPYIATERIRLASGPRLDRGYFGTGVRWDISDNFMLTGALWNDFGENYRLSAETNFVPHGSLNVNLMGWVMLDKVEDYRDAWAFWRATISHPVDEDILATVVYEDSTRSDGVVLVGFSVVL